ARMQAKAQQDLARLFSDQLSSAGLAAETVETYATPRRLALIARNLPAETAAVREETKGPRSSAPPQALEGFLRKTGLTRDQLEERDGVYFAVVDKPGRATSAVLAEAIPAIVRAFPWPKSMRWGEASVSTESPRWVRPLQGIVALLGEEIVEFEIAGVRSGAATVGHRFHHPGVITIGGAHDYVEKLQACHVVVDPAERTRIIAEGARAAAAAAGLTLVEDEGLLAENAGLTEWPVPLLGSFDPAFLDLPREVVQLTMRTNQKYFALLDPPRDGEGDRAERGGGGVEPGSEPPPPGFAWSPSPSRGGLAPNFVCTANIEATDGGGAIVAGNERVLSARLADAKFFWEQDLKVPLEEQAGKLGDIVFHEKLGTVADKVERVAKLARWLVEEGIVGGEKPLSPAGRGQGEGVQSPTESSAAEPPHPGPLPAGERENLANLAERAARLCKADLVTGLVGEFPELQGVIGGHFARAQGEPDAVADAIRDHYRPAGQGDEVPTAPVTVAVSLADKLDSLCQFFLIDEAPTGSKDPFALRRAALAVISIIVQCNLRLRMEKVLLHAVGDDLDKFEKVFFGHTEKGLTAFFADRLKVQQREAGVRHDLIDAVFALGGEDDLVRLLARVKALQAFVETPEGTDLLTGYKRAANILKREGWAQTVIPAKAGTQEHNRPTPEAEVSTSASLGPGFRRDDDKAEQVENETLPYEPEIEEAALIAALDSAEPLARAAVAAEDFEGAMAALASLRGPVDAFFDKVTVNDPDPTKREARLALLARMRDAVHGVADFSRIEG
ncbi:MAG TPA: glycine--tRNA ligase subunit beta, partial [Allosphingosinicella sp.]|nr:glycine--tRNA ligase subunit beta [Allosphingosinicella sp.]